MQIHLQLLLALGVSSGFSYAGSCGSGGGSEPDSPDIWSNDVLSISKAQAADQSLGKYWRADSIDCLFGGADGGFYNGGAQVRDTFLIPTNLDQAFEDNDWYSWFGAAYLKWTWDDTEGRTCVLKFHDPGNVLCSPDAAGWCQRSMWVREVSLVNIQPIE
ncbi:MAG: hypothetical protein IPL79_07540 [Myxococcales bacterium]|nr:hypothetical protein [Myxococcales bacterium]